MTHTEKINESGEMYITSSAGITCYDLLTYSGKYRGGKIYYGNKKYIVLSGSCELIQEIEGKDVRIKVSPENGIFEIASGIPHIFYFPEDTRMIEWFAQGTKSINFERYRKMK